MYSADLSMSRVPSVEGYPAGLDRLDMTHPHDVLDAPQLGEFGLRQDRAPVHRRVDGRVDAQQAPLRLQPIEEVWQRFGLVHRGELVREVAQHSFGELRTGLDRGAVQDPRVAGLDPRQPLRRDAVPQQPQAGVHRGLARADDHVAVPGLADARQLVGRHAIDPASTA